MDSLVNKIIMDDRICYYPDWDGGFITGKHTFDKDGFCIFCGYKTETIILDNDNHEGKV